MNIRYLVLLLALSNALPSICLGLDTSDLRSRTRFYLRDSSKPSALFKTLFSNAELLKILNDCQDEIVSLALPLISSHTFTPSSGTYEYNLPIDYIAIDRVIYNKKSLEEVTVAGLDADNEDWSATTGLPTKYYIRNSTYPIFGLNPTPLTTSTYPATIFYYSQGNDLVASTDVPFNGFKQYSSFHPAVAYCAASKGWMILGDANMAKFYNDLYISMIQRMIDWKSIMPNFNPAMRGDRGK